MKGTLLTLALTVVSTCASNAFAQAVTISDVGYGAHIHQRFNSDVETLSEFRFFFHSKPDGSTLIENSKSHMLRSFAMLREDHHYYLNYRDEVVDDPYDYEIGYDFAPRPPVADIFQTVHMGTCNITCEVELPDFGLVPALQGVSLEFTSIADDHKITEIESFIDRSNILTVSFREKDENWEFKYLVQVVWLDPMDVAGDHWEVSNRGMADKFEHVYMPVDFGGTPLMKGFRLRYVNNSEGSKEDSHYVREVAVDLGDNRVAFNDGDKDDYFDYDISYLTLM